MAVVIAICMVMLLGFSGLALDVAGVWSERKQLQNGADASALAIAQGCSDGNCGSTQLIANDYVGKNKLDGQFGTPTVTVNMGQSTVTVTTFNDRKNWFAGIFNSPTVRVPASAKATWGNVSGGMTLPLTISQCEFREFGLVTGGPPLNKDLADVPIKSQGDNCSWPAHNSVPGGFGWLDSDPNCRAYVLAGDTVGSDTGVSGPTPCNSFNWTTIRDQVVLLPIFDASVDQGAHATYHIAGLAAFKVTGYCLMGQQWNISPCSVGKQALRGYFTDYTALGPDVTWNSSATNFGVVGVKLTA